MSQIQWISMMRMGGAWGSGTWDGTFWLLSGIRVGKIYSHSVLGREFKSPQPANLFFFASHSKPQVWIRQLVFYLAFFCCGPSTASIFLFVNTDEWSCWIVVSSCPNAQRRSHYSLSASSQLQVLSHILHLTFVFLEDEPIEYLFVIWTIDGGYHHEDWIGVLSEYLHKGGRLVH